MEYRPCGACLRRLPFALLSPSGLCPRCVDHPRSALPADVLRCPSCAQTFKPTRAWQKCCSEKCRIALHYKSGAEMLEKAAEMLLEKEARIRELLNERDALLRELSALRKGG